MKIPMAWTVAFLHAMGQPESRSRNVIIETSRSDQVADEKGPFLRFSSIFIDTSVIHFTVKRLVRASRRRRVMSCDALASRC